MAGKKRQGNPHRKEKYKSQPLKTIANKKRKMEKHLTHNPNDNQTAEKLNG